MPILLDLYLTFFFLGGTSFGGGYAMLPALKRTIAEKKGWATEEELSDYFAIGQCTPGIIAVNVATFIGMKFMGVKGAIVATLGMVSPCIIIISTLATLVQHASNQGSLDAGFHGIKVCVAILIATSAWGIVKKALVDHTASCIFYGTLSAMLLRQLYPEMHPLLYNLTSPVTLVVLSGFLGCMVQKNKQKQVEKENVL